MQAADLGFDSCQIETDFALLLLVADGLARSLVAPQELPVGVLTAVLGGGYLLWLLQRPGTRGGLL